MQKLISMLSGKSDTVFKFLATLILVFVILYPKFPLLPLSKTFISIRLEDFIILISFLISLPFILINRKNILRDGVFLIYLFFLAVGFFSVVASLLLTKSTDLGISMLHFFRRVEYFIPFVIGYFAVKDKKDLKYFMNLLLIIVVIVFIYGWGQKNFNWPVIVTQNEEYSRGVALRFLPGGHLNSTFAGHYDLASFLILVFPLFAGYFFYFKEVKNPFKYTAFVVFVYLLGLWLMAYSGSRISIVSYFASIGIFFSIVGKLKWLPVVVIASLLVFYQSPSLKLRYERIFEVTKSKFTTELRFAESVYASELGTGLPEKRKESAPTPTPIPVFEDRSTSIRLNVEWPRAIRAFYKNPFLGTGYSSIDLATDNDYLRALGETGLIGLSAFISLILIILARLIKLFKSAIKKDLFVGIIAAGYFSGFVGILINALFIDIFEASKFAMFFWLFLGIISSLNLKYEKSN
jgi:hypothetical protein